jgi:hypothetical protein
MGALGCRDGLEALVPGQAKKDARVVRVVLDHQQHRIAGRDAIAVIEDVFLARRR